MTLEELSMALRMRRHIEVAPCARCQGWGTITYGSTALWRGGMGGATLTSGVCDLCWGSGDETRPWTDLRKLEAEEAERVNARAATLLDESMAKGFINKHTRGAQAALADLLDAAERKRKLPAGVDSLSWSALCRTLSKRLRAFSKAGE